MADPQVQIVDLPIVGGEAQNQDERAGQGLLLVQDLVYRRRGGLEPRPGQEPLSPTNRTNGYQATGSVRDAILTRGDSLAIVEGSTVRPYAADVGTDGELGSVGLASAYYVELDPLEGSTTEQIGMQVAVSGTGYLAAAWIEQVSGSAYNVLVELFSEDGVTLIPTKKVATSVDQPSAPQVVYVDGNFIVTWVEAGATNVVNAATFDPATGAIGAVSLLFLTQVSASFGYRVAPHSDGTSMILVVGYPDGADPATVTLVRFFDKNLVQLNAATFALTQPGGIVTATSFGIYTETPTRVWIAVGYTQNYTVLGSHNVYGDVVLVDGSNPAAPTETWRRNVYQETQSTGSARQRYIFATSVIEVASNECHVAYSRLEREAASITSPTCKTSVAFYRAQSGSSSVLSWAFGCILESDLWKHASGDVFCEVIESTELAQEAVGIIPPLGSAHIVSTRPPATTANSGAVTNKPCQVHATFAVGQVTPPYAFDGFAWNVTQGTRKQSNQAQIAVLSSGEVATVVYAKQLGAAPPAPKLLRASEATARSHAELQGIVLVSGGTPTLYDGQSATEYGFQHIPLISSVSNLGPGNVVDGDYLYAVEYQWIAGTGAVLHSLVAGSDLYTATGGPSELSVQVRLPQLSHKPDNQASVSNDFSAVAVILYRTIAGSTGPFYRLTSINVPFGQLAEYGEASIFIDDDYPDTGGADGDLATFPQLYTSGGVLQAFPAPSARLVVAWLGRFVLAGTDDDSICFSTEAVQGEVPYFNLALRAQPFEGGRVTGLAVLDDKLIVFKRSGIFVLQGQLPDQRGLNGSIPAPTTIATDAGCVDPYSVVVAPAGVFFRSERGIQLLDRGLNISLVGENVTLDVEAAGPIVAPLLVPKQTQVRFDAPVDGGEGFGPVLAFDYLQGAWTRWLVDKSTAPEGRVPVASATLRGRPYWLDYLGTLWRERYSSYTDGDATPRPFTYRVRTSWFAPGGLSGYFKTLAVHVLGEWGFPHTLTVTVFVDYDDATPVCSTSFDVPANPSAGYEFRASVTSARAARVQSASVEVVVSWDGASTDDPDEVPATLSGIALEILPIGGGQRRIPATQKG